MEFLRTELQWSSSPDNDEKRGFLSRFGLKPSRVALLVVAIISAVVAALLATSNTPEPAPKPVAPPPAQVVEVPTTRILVATATIDAGEPLTDKSIGWHEVPISTLLPGYISAESDPEALATYSQSVARYTFFAGDPIRADKLLDSPQRSLSDILSPGMRGISVAVNAGTAAGGFIKPDDHVDVLLAASGTTRTVLEDVRVLALGDKFGPSTTGDASEDPELQGKGFKGTTTAILELDPVAAEVLVKASANGELTLTLRPPDTANTEERDGANQAIRLNSAFWNERYSPAAH